MDYNEIITDEHYQTAAENGISKINVNNRVYNCGWQIIDAITSPLQKGRKPRFSQEARDLAKANGVSNSTMYYRVDKIGMDEMEAAGTPVLSQADAVRENQKKQWIHTTEEIIELRKANNIAYSIYYERVTRSNWDSAVAASKPVGKARVASS